MSTLRVGTIQNEAGTGSPDIAGGELCRARFNLNGTGTIAARDSFNVSSFTDRGTGQYTATFATAFPAGNWSSTLNARATGTYYALLQSPTIIASEIGFDSVNTSGSVTDADQFHVSVFGDRP